jgi:hypothetical protein
LGGLCGVLRAQIETPGAESLAYSVEWRLITAGKAKLSRGQSGPASQVNLHLESTGLVSKLFRVNDDYIAQMDASLCALASVMTAQEGRRQRETRVTFDASARKASYLEKDPQKNTVIAQQEVEIPACTHEITGALYRLRALNLQPGQSAQIPVSDGKKAVSVKVEAQQREKVSTPSGVYQTVKHEAHLFNNVLYRRPGRVYIWLTDDGKRLPVQIQVKLQFHIGTITLQLEKQQT